MASMAGGATCGVERVASVHYDGRRYKRKCSKSETRAAMTLLPVGNLRSRRPLPSRSLPSALSRFAAPCWLSTHARNGTRTASTHRHLRHAQHRVRTRRRRPRHRPRRTQRQPPAPQPAASLLVPRRATARARLRCPPGRARAARRRAHHRAEEGQGRVRRAVRRVQVAPGHDARGQQDANIVSLRTPASPACTTAVFLARPLLGNSLAWGRSRPRLACRARGSAGRAGGSWQARASLILPSLSETH